ncbi:hypothetical protein [Streptomyces sp. CNZ748]|uniref:hypothetical protein n=1 Tax=Streptomyces sp. CNZ748 TaxID=2885160 RepID=UPI001E412D18|nr:hypothetical protein [Streptomyces sp. CNZ748]
MAEVENTPETPQEPAVSPSEGAEVESVPEVDSTPQAGPEDVSAELEAARAEAETMRTALDAAKARAKAAELALERERVGRRHGLPDELVPFLRGETAEALEAEAKTLAKYAAGTRSGLGTGGLDPNDTQTGGSISRILRKSREF